MAARRDKPRTIKHVCGDLERTLTALAQRSESAQGYLQAIVAELKSEKDETERLRADLKERDYEVEQSARTLRLAQAEVERLREKLRLSGNYLLPLVEAELDRQEARVTALTAALECHAKEAHRKALVADKEEPDYHEEDFEDCTAEPCVVARAALDEGEVRRKCSMPGCPEKPTRFVGCNSEPYCERHYGQLVTPREKEA